MFPEVRQEEQAAAEDEIVTLQDVLASQAAMGQEPDPKLAVRLRELMLRYDVAVETDDADGLN